MGLAYSFDHYAAAPDAEDRAGRVFNNKVEQVRQELWVSNEGYIVFVCRISSYARRDMRTGRMWWLPDAVKNSSWTCTTRRASRPS